ncbi:hypothetical protein AVDCRST_MAG94-4738 [uncultured Leptolyngbya sp.]|uniref:Uncharacterized protein n=1 Tax=uncultured Leptolyngbya sp. TaxID=332963 RepID=A0A6J4N666_9CYAN|nr:hypothetical protein AVDCRST_MAG94-4738 [uncultured Leptolyngbya sp.]
MFEGAWFLNQVAETFYQHPINSRTKGGLGMGNVTQDNAHLNNQGIAVYLSCQHSYPLLV